MIEPYDHSLVGVDTILYNFDSKSAKILDLTKPKIAKTWGYVGGDDYDVAQAIAVRARQSGFNGIRYSSERGAGSNLAIFNNFEKLLTPQMISPIPKELQSSMSQFKLH